MHSNLERATSRYNFIENKNQIGNLNNVQKENVDEFYTALFYENIELGSGNCNSNKIMINKKELEKITMKLKNNLSRASLKAKRNSFFNSDKNICKKLDYEKTQLSAEEDNFYLSKLKIGEVPSKTLFHNKRSPTRLNTLSLVCLNFKKKNKISEYDFDFLGTPTKKKKHNNYTHDCFIQDNCDVFTEENVTDVCGKLKPAFNENSNLLSHLKSEDFLKFMPFDNKDLDFEVVKNKKKNFENDSVIVNSENESPIKQIFDQEKCADLLMYLATSPPSIQYDISPSQKLSFTLSQCSTGKSLKSPFSDLMISPRTMGSQNDCLSLNLSSNILKIPDSPFTPMLSSSLFPKTPKIILPTIKNISNNKQSSSCLTLTPNGFDMSKYLNLFTPSPNGVSINKFILKTPDFITNSTQFSSYFNDDYKMNGKESHLI